MPVWHLIWMGVWTGYTMAVVGEAAGIFALPYSMSILQFVNASVTPSTQLLTFLNPFGALLGFRRSGQWNLKFAAAVCIGGAVGGLIGPFLRAGLLARGRRVPFRRRRRARDRRHPSVLRRVPCDRRAAGRRPTPTRTR